MALLKDSLSSGAAVWLHRMGNRVKDHTVEIGPLSGGRNVGLYTANLFEAL